MRRIATLACLAVVGLSATAALAAAPNSEIGTLSTKAGKIITDASGRSLYLFVNDKGTTSTCYGTCAEVWPPFTASVKPKAIKGAESSLIGLTKRKSGPEQVTYDGHPLYYYASDTKAGEITGNGLKDSFGLWYALRTSGARA